MRGLHRSLRGAVAFALSCAMALGTLPAEALAEAIGTDGEIAEQVEVVDTETVPSEGAASQNESPVADEPPVADESLTVESAPAMGDGSEEEEARKALLAEGISLTEEGLPREEDETVFDEDTTDEDTTIGIQSEGSTNLSDGYHFLFDGGSGNNNERYCVKDGESVTPSIKLYYSSSDRGYSEGMPIVDSSKYTLKFYQWDKDASEWKAATPPFFADEHSYKVVASAKSNSGLTGSVDGLFRVFGPFDLSGAIIELPGAGYNFSSGFRAGTTTTPVVELNGVTVPESGYTLEYESWTSSKTTTTFPKKAGLYWVYARGIAPYKNYAMCGLAISAPISDVTVSPISPRSYTGDLIEPKPTIKYDGKTLRLGRDYLLDYSDNDEVGTASITITGGYVYAGTRTVTFKIVKAVNTLKAKATKSKVSCLYKPSANMSCAKNVTVTKAVGKVTYTNVSTNATAKKFTVNKKTGKITVKKGTKKGTYKVKIKVKAAGNRNYKAGSKTVSYKIVVAKGANPMTVRAVTRTVSCAEVSSGNAIVARPMTVSKAKGALSYAKAGGSGNLAVNKKDGRVMVKQGTARGTYKIKIKVTAAGNSSYKAGSKTVTCTIKVV